MVIYHCFQTENNIATHSCVEFTLRDHASHPASVSCPRFKIYFYIKCDRRCYSSCYQPPFLLFIINLDNVRYIFIDILCLNQNIIMLFNNLVKDNL